MKKRLGFVGVVGFVLLISACSVLHGRHDEDGQADMREMQQGVPTASSVMEQFADLDKLLKQTPARDFSGNGDLPCDRHDGVLWKLEGGNGRDVIACSWGDEIIMTHGGNDAVEGGWGNEAIHGGEGNDTLKGSWGDEVIYGGSGNDTLEGSWGDEVIYGGSGNDTIDSSWGNAVINGGSGDDHINTGFGRVVLLYGKDWGHDTLNVSCGRFPVVLVFSKENKKDDLVWSGKSLENTKTHGKITFSSSTECVKTVYSREEFS